MEDDIISRLKQLVSSGHCVLPFCVPSLQLFEPSGRVPVNQELQNRFVRYPGTNEAEPARKAVPAFCVYNPLHVPFAAELTIEEAPSIIGFPIVDGPHLQVPFKAVLKVVSYQPLTFHCNSRAFLVGVETLSKGLHGWTPPEVDTTVLEGCNAATVCLQPEYEDEDHKVVYVGKAFFFYNNFLDFERADGDTSLLKWLIVHMQLHGVELYTQLKMPICIIEEDDSGESREAFQLLWQGGPLTPRSEYLWPDLSALKLFVEYKLRKSIGIERELDVPDQLSILQRAGYILIDNASMDVEADENANNGIEERLLGGPETDEIIAGFHDYINKTQALLRIIKDNYEHRSPKQVCGIGVGRQETEALLEKQVPGTFLVRFGSEAGTLVVSSLLRTSKVDHVKLRLSDLQRITLETVGHYPTLPPMQHSFPCLQEWISRIEPAKYLLDTSNGTRHPKDDVFGTGYREIHDLLEALRQEPLMEEAEDGVVNSFPAEPCCGDAAINELITSPVEEQDPCTFPAVEGEQLPDQELSGLYAQAGLNFTHGHEVYNNARARMALSEDDANTTPPPLQTFGL